jgi:flagellar basal-body rod protein FlgB
MGDVLPAPWDKEPTTMDLGALDLFKAMAAKMSWLGQRQAVIAQNVANVDTPGYQALDLKSFSFGDALGQTLAPARTDPMHLSGTKPGGPRTDRERKAYEVTPTGNSVSLEEQMQKAATTGADFQMITNLYKKSIGFITTALDRGGASS